jgi:hypothetical protein
MPDFTFAYTYLKVLEPDFEGSVGMALGASQVMGIVLGRRHFMHYIL